MAKTGTPDTLGRRERQIMDVIHQLGTACVVDVRQALPDPPTYSTVRAMLRLLEDKGHLTHHADGRRYVYTATMSQRSAQTLALEHLVQTFFAGSASAAAASLLELSDAPVAGQCRASRGPHSRRVAEEPVT